MKNISNDSFSRSLATNFYSHKRIILLVFFIVFISFLAYAILMPDMYRADGSFLVKAKNIEMALEGLKENEVKVTQLTKADLVSESQIMRSGQVVNTAAQKLIDEKLISIESEDKKTNLVDKLAKKISDNYSVDIDYNSKLIQPTIDWANLEEAKIILNTLMNVYLNYRLEILNSVQTIDLSKTEVSSYLDDWKDKKEQTLELIKKHNVPEPDLELANNLELKKEYQIQLALLEKDRVSLKEDIKILTSMLNDQEMHLFSFLSNGVLSSLVESLQAIKKEKVEADKLFLPSRIEVKELDAEFNKNYSKLKAEVESHLRKQKSVLNAKEESIADMNYNLKKLDSRNIQLKEISIKMDQLKMEASFLASSFETYYQKHNVGQTGGVLDANIIILNPAQSQMTLDKQMRIKIALFGFILAIVLSIIIAFILDAMETKVKTKRDLQRHLDFPVLFSIKEIK